MKYSNGQKVRVGDKVNLWGNCSGTVVCSIDTNEYSKEYPKEQWEYLKQGVLINSDKGGLIHYLEPDEDLILIDRE
jgi:hypothetical protein